MCRMFILISKKNNSNIKNNWLESWYNAAKCDPRLPLAPEDCSHGDGWGFIQANYKDKKLKVINRLKNVDPLYNCDLSKIEQTLDDSIFLGLDESILLAHARKASANMPKLLQQIHPFENFHYKTQETTFLTHNGLVSKTILNNRLKNKLSDLTVVSDTQMLTFYFQEKMESAPMSLDLWANTLNDIIREHEKTKEKYTMQLFFLTIGSQYYKLYVSSAYGEYNPGVEKLRGYYTLYQCQNDKYISFCSSTVVDNFKEKYFDDTWKIEPIENNTSVELNYTFQNGNMEINTLHLSV